MPHGWKDYTMPVTVEAVTVETLPVDIKAQTIAALKIDIAAQTLSQLNVNIAASAITLDVNISASAVTLNVKTAVGEHVDADIVSSITLNTDIVAQSVGNIGVDIKAQTLPQLNVNIAASAVTLNVNIASSATTLNVNLAASAITLNVNIAASAVTLNVKTATGEHVDADIVSSITLKTDITAQSVGNIGVDIKAQTLGQLNVNIAASAITLNVNIASSAVTLNVNIAASAVTLNVNIASSSTTLNVNIASSATTLNVCIASQTVDVNVKTSGGANIVIDKLTQAAYTSRVDTLAWNGTSPSWTAPTGNVRRGKLFPRGARGFIRNIGVYCRDAGTEGGTVYVYISPAPYLGSVYSGTITVPAAGAADWRNWTVDKMWNYDSLFIWAYTSSSYIQLAYDSGGPDSFSSANGGLTWIGSPTDRYWFRAEVQGMTVGDVPVSGTLNTVEIPAVSSELLALSFLSVSPGATETLLEKEGSGWIDGLSIRIYSAVAGGVAPSYMTLILEVDGVAFEKKVWDLLDIIVGWNANTHSPVSFPNLDNTNYNYNIVWNFPITFKRKFRVLVKNTHSSGEIRAKALAVAKLVS